MISNTAHIRQVIRSFNKQPFRATDLPRYDNLHQSLNKMVARGEISVAYDEPSPDTHQKPRKVYKEIRLQMDRANASAKKKEKLPDPWIGIWPEFYAPPALVGQTRVFVTPLD